MSRTEADGVLTFTVAQEPAPAPEASVTLLSRIKTMAESADNSGDLHEVTAVLLRALRLTEVSGAGEEDAGSSGIREFTCHRVPCSARVVPGWLSALTAVVCHVSGCHWCFGRWRDGHGNPRRSVTFRGRGALPAVAECLFTLLCRQMLRDLNIWQKVSDRERLETTATWYRTEDWCCHWAAGIWSALLAPDIPADEPDTPGVRQQYHYYCHRRYQQLTGSGAFISTSGAHSCLFPAGNRHIHIKEEQP